MSTTAELDVVATELRTPDVASESRRLTQYVVGPEERCETGYSLMRVA